MAQIRDTRAAAPANAIVHAECGKWWTGLSVHHCSGCHETFTGLSTFDMHRTGSHPKGTRECQPPESVGLVDMGRKYPCWGSELSESQEWWKSGEGA